MKTLPIYLSCVLLTSLALAGEDYPDLGARLGAAHHNSQTPGQSKLCSGGEALKFYPLGFSKKGAFAYLIHSDEGPISVWQFIVIDLVRDKRLARISQEDPDGSTELKNFTFVKKDEIQKLLKKHRIPAQDTGKPTRLSKVKKGYRAIFMSLSGKSKQSASPHGLHLMAPGLGQKKVTTIESPADENCCRLLGALKSPYEPRAALLVLHGAQGFEGRVSCNLTVTGAHLESGFK